LGRQAYLLAVLLFITWQIYNLAAAWVSHQAAARAVVFALIQPVMTSLGAAAGTVIIFYAFVNLLNTFTNRGDLRLLLLTPVRPEIVLGERIIVVSLGFSFILLIAIPAFFAIGTGVGVTPLYYPAVLVALLLLPVAPTALGALVLLPLLRWLPPARARTISMLVGVGLGIAFLVVNRVVRQMGGRTVPSLPDWLPLTWPGRFVAGVALGDAGTAFRYGLLTLTLAAALFTLATLAAARVFATGVATYGEVGSRRRRAAALPGLDARGVDVSGPIGPTARRPSWWPVFIKDWRSIRRDPQRLILFLYPLAIIGFNAFSLLANRSGRNKGFGVGTTLILLMVASMLLVTTTTPSIVNREGKAIILLALAPISPAAVILSKWIVAALPPFVVVEVALVGLSIYLGLPPGESALLALIFAALVLALSGTTLAINLAWPKLGATNPRRQSSATAALVSLVSDAVICLVTGALLFLGLLVRHGVYSALAMVGLFAALGAVIALAAWLMPRLLQRLLHGDRPITTVS
jgi:ABC-2 type transport system permease protein